MYTYDFPPPSVACLKNNAWNNFLLLLFLLQTVFLCNPGWPWTQVLPVFKTCILSPSSTSTSSAKKHIPHKLLLLTDSSHQEAQAFTICVPHSLLSEGQRWSTQQSQTTSEERLSTWNPQLLDKEGCSQCLPKQRGGDKVPGQMESATKHKQCHACLPSVVISRIRNVILMSNNYLYISKQLWEGVWMFLTQMINIWGARHQLP